MPVEVIEAIADLRRRVAGWRREGVSVALVPTMGNLHAGHLALLSEARELADRTIVSIFVNPLQFGPTEDFAAYPRTLEQDRLVLNEGGADVLFAPAEEALYPHGREEQTRVEVPHISDILCGASRRGHFVGVATVVCKLFNIAQPDVAVFGEKDFQQLLVIRRMAADLCLPIDVRALATVREADGVAMSSRNGYLTRDERALAPELYKALRRAVERLREGRVVGEVEQDGLSELEANRLRPDYFRVLRASDLRPPAGEDRELVVLAAAYLGKARLIDNIQASRDPS